MNSFKSLIFRKQNVLNNFFCPSVAHVFHNGMNLINIICQLTFKKITTDRNIQKFLCISVIFSSLNGHQLLLFEHRSSELTSPLTKRLTFWSYKVIYTSTKNSSTFDISCLQYLPSLCKTSTCNIFIPPPIISYQF